MKREAAALLCVRNTCARSEFRMMRALEPHVSSLDHSKT